MVEKKKARITSEYGGEEEDRISRLSDELLHKVLSFMDTKWAVQTSVLSKRWKLIWTTPPFLKFHQTIFDFSKNTDEVARQVLTQRNHQTPISSLEPVYLDPLEIMTSSLEPVYLDPLEIMTAKEKIDAAAFESLDPYVLKLRDERYGWKYGCGAKGCTKHFFAAKFVARHLKLKHPELLLDTSKVREDLYFQNYMGDENAPGAVPVLQPTVLNNMIPQIAAAAVTAQNVVPQNPSAAPTKVLVDSENIKKTMCIDTVDMKVQDENVAQNSALAVNKARQICAPVERTGNDQASNSRGNSDFGLWHGHEINSEFVCLLNLIMNKYPETFEHFITKNKKFSTMKLNMLCSSVINLTKTSMSEVDTELIAECRDVFAGLQNFGFNVSWLVNRLNYIEKLRFSQPLAEIHAIDLRINDAKTKLQDLQTLRSEKMQEIQKAFGTMGTNLVVGCIGDDLFSGWGSGRGGYTGAANTSRSQREGLMSYKQFIQELEDDILPAEAERRYQEYKSEYITTQKRAYFNAHKHEEWLKDKYHPTNLLAVIDRRNEHARKMSKDFLLELQSGTVDIGPGIDASASKAGQTAYTYSENEVDAGGKMKQHERGLAKQTDFTKAPPVSSEPRQEEWEKKLDSFWKERLNGQDPLEIMTAKEKIDAAAFESLDPYVRKLRDERYGWKYGCGAKGCTKLFFAAKFVARHLKLKHPELLLDTSKVREDMYFQNYMGDENAPGAVPVLQPTVLL